MNDRKIKMIFIITSIITLLLGLIGVTFAYFSSESQIANEFNAGKYKTTATENFVSPTNWKPGDTTPKTLTVKNEGDIDMYVRVSYTESWENKDGEDLPLEQDGNRAAIINLDNQSDWTKRGNYYYYEDVLHPNDVTTSLLESVTFNQNVVGDYECIKEGDKTTCSSTGDSYEGGTYTLTFNIETVQSDAKDEVWNPIQYVNRQNEGQITAGDEIAIAGEHFYVVSSDQNETVLLAKYNLLVGDIFEKIGSTWTKTKTMDASNTEGYGLQSEIAKGYNEVVSTHRIGVVAFSGKGYWDNAEYTCNGTSCSITGTQGLKSEYANASNAEGTTTYTSPYPYVYRSNIGNDVEPQYTYTNPWGYAQDNGYTIAYYVEYYVGTLKGLGAPNTITGRLLSYEEANSLSDTIKGNWYYWIGSGAGFYSVWSVGIGSFHNELYWVDSYDGVRPVIIVRTSDI